MDIHLQRHSTFYRGVAPCSATTTTNLDARAVYDSETTRSPPLPSFLIVFTFLDFLFLHSIVFTNLFSTKIGAAVEGPA